MTDEDRYGGYTPLRATRFYIPLLVQAFSQSLTYPLVAAIVTHGQYGVNTLTAFAQGQTVMFMITSLGGGLVTTGMVFGRSRRGLDSFRRLNLFNTLAVLAIQALLSFGPIGEFIFGTVLRLPPELAQIARQTLFWGILMNASFFMRNTACVVLFNHRASFEANLATLVRIALTAAASPLFIHLGWTGAMWGLVATTIPCYVECILSNVFARKYLARVGEEGENVPVACAMRQLRFSMPLSFGSFLLASAPFMIAAFVGCTEDAVAMLAIHYVTIGLANPVGFGALRMQTVAVQFPPEYRGDWRLLRFAACAGLVLGLMPLCVATPWLGRWYFGTVQNVPEGNLSLACTVMMIYALWPLVQCVRGWVEGLAAWRKLPMMVFWGQLANILVLVATLGVSLFCGMKGWLMGCVAIFAASIATTATIAIGMGGRRAETDDFITNTQEEKRNECCC